jgi:signal transduction histidine kinase
MEGRRALGVVCTVIAVTFSVLGSIVAFAGEASVPNDKSLHPTALQGLSFLIAIGAAVMLCWRHRWPELVFGIALLPPLLASDPMALLVALAAVAARRRDSTLWLAGAATFAATMFAAWRDAGWVDGSQIVGRWIPADGPGRVVGTLLTAAVLTAIPLILGLLRGTRADLRARELSEARLRDEVARQEERSRIAHEMHDVLGHRLSLLSLQAGALEVSPPDAAGDAARTVRSTAKQSLDDLRQVIGVLRDGRDFQLHGPAPSLVDLPTLIEETKQAGVPVNVMVLLDPSAAPAQLGMAVYRIVQESLTNVLRHAPGCPVEVTIRGGPGAGVHLDIVNPLPLAGSPPSPGSGTGLTGISERVTALGGKAHIGATPHGTFMVQAWLPWPPAPSNNATGRP